ncbi:MAG: biopolymer transporter ExbD [Deltaproteobacteria bacterium]|jgi:biopolymer transport protein TolR|nr:biopolymer transporter ExbD [Deltaproteobacteria bacterium]
MDVRDELIPGQSEIQTISDINVTPFIDVMLVLLIIFMVTAPLMMGGVRINLPKTAGTPMPRPERPLIVSLDAKSVVYVDKEPVDGTDRHILFRKLALDSASGEVFVRGDGEVKYGEMMNLMADLGQAGFARVTLVTNVKTAGDASGASPASAASGGAAGSPAADAPGAGSPSSPSPASPAPAPAAQAAPAAASAPGA